MYRPITKNPSVRSVSRIQSRKFGKQEYYGDNWENLSKRVREQANYVCSVCNKNYSHNKSFMETDHLCSISSGGRNNITNLQALCKDCHKKKTQLR